jgi:hypothetical protein
MTRNISVADLHFYATDELCVHGTMAVSPRSPRADEIVEKIECCCGKTRTDCVSLTTQRTTDVTAVLTAVLAFNCESNVNDFSGSVRPNCFHDLFFNGFKVE